MTTWKENKRWSDRFLPEIKRILGERFIGEPPYEEDAEHNTDLIVLKLEPLRFGCRVRRNQYVDRYGDEFTIRAGRPSGAKTELTKIIEGWGDYLFYGFSDSEEKTLAQWAIIDLKVFRAWHSRQLYIGEHPGIGNANVDGSSSFIAFKLSEMPEAITATWGEHA